MLDARPPLSPGRIIGLSLAIILILLDIGFLALIFVSPIGLITVSLGLLILLSLPVIGIVIFVTAGIMQARYGVDEGLLTIRWGRMEQLIPLTKISEIIPSDGLIETRDFRGVRWPGCMFGQGVSILQDGREIPSSYLATRPIEEQILIIAGGRAFGLSPKDPFAFEASLRALISSETEDDATAATSEMDILDWSLWPDKNILILIGSSILLNLVLFALLAVLFNQFPDEVPLHYDQSGEVDRFGKPSDLFIVPLIGLVAWLVAAIGAWYFYYLRHESVIAYLICGFTVFIEAATWVAVVGLLLQIS